MDHLCPNCRHAFAVEAPGRWYCPACNQEVDVAPPIPPQPEERVVIPPSAPLTPHPWMCLRCGCNSRATRSWGLLRGFAVVGLIALGVVCAVITVIRPKMVEIFGELAALYMFAQALIIISRDHQSERHCEVCGSTEVVPKDSPRGRKIIAGR